MPEESDASVCSSDEGRKQAVTFLVHLESGQ